MGEHPVVLRTRHFYDWEIRGRGWVRYEYPVVLEPPFRPFERLSSRHQQIDDGRRETFLSQLVSRLHPGEHAEPQAKQPEPPPDENDVLLGDEAEILIPKDLSITPQQTAQWLRSLEGVQHPISFELVGHDTTVTVRLATHHADTSFVHGALAAWFPKTTCVEPAVPLSALWEETAERASILEFGLLREFVVPLARPASFATDPLTAVVGALGQAGPDECAAVQVLVAPTRAPWRDELLKAVTTPTGKPFFADAPEITAHAREKAASPLFSVVLRLGIAARSDKRVWSLLRPLSSALSGFGSPEGNALVPVSDEGEYPEYEADLLRRTSHRSGMLLSLDEVVGLAHLPAASLAVPALSREHATTAPAPEALQGDGVLLGTNSHRGTTTAVFLPEAEHLKHVHIVGASGTGKSTLLAQLILGNIERGAGVGLIDPHGDLVDAVLSRLPGDRLRDVVLLDPSSERFAVGYNMLGAHDVVEREMLTADLVALFKKLSTSWGDQMTAVLSHALGALLSGSQERTLLDLRRFLADEGFRRFVLAGVADEYVSTFWRREFPQLKGHPQAPILTRLDTFLRSAWVRQTVTRTAGPLDVRALLDSGGILLVKLSQGALGAEQAALLGSLLVSTIHQKALARQDTQETARRPFFLYLDEFHDVATASMAALFSGARKFRLALTVAHQNLYQLHSTAPEVERAVLANAHTRVVFRVGEDDARKLAQGFAHFHDADLAALGVGQAILRVGGRTNDCNLETRALPEVDSARAAERMERVQQAMEERFPPETPPPPAASAPPKPPSPTPPPTPPPKPPPVAAEAPQGHGGPEHTYLQELFTRFAQERGFRVVNEEPTPDGGKVDLGLYHGERRVALEIAITTTAEHEMQNVEKCLKAGYGDVVVVSRRKSLRRELTRQTNDLENVLVASPEEALSFLASFTAAESTALGYQVKRRYRNVSDDSNRERTVAKVIAESLRRLKGEE